MTSAKVSPLLLFGNAKEKDVYTGSMIFDNRTIRFHNTTILRQNFSKLEQYGLKKAYKISTSLLVLSILLAIGAFFFMPYGVVILIITALPMYAGIKERNEPLLSGFTIELNSGSAHTFLSPDTQGITTLVDAISGILEKEETLHIKAEWQPKTIEITTYTLAFFGLQAVTFAIDCSKKNMVFYFKTRNGNLCCLKPSFLPFRFSEMEVLLSS